MKRESYQGWRSPFHPSPRNYGSSHVGTGINVSEAEPVAGEFAHLSQAEFRHIISVEETAGGRQRHHESRHGSVLRKKAVGPEMERKISKTIEELESELAKTRQKLREQRNFRDTAPIHAIELRSPVADVSPAFGTTPLRDFRQERGRSAEPTRDRDAGTAKRSEPEISNCGEMPLSIKFAVHRTEEHVISTIRKNGIVVPPKLREEVSRIFDTLSETMKGLSSVHTESKALTSSSGARTEEYKKLMKPFQDEYDKLQQTLAINSRLIGIEMGKIDIELNNVRSALRLQSGLRRERHENYGRAAYGGGEYNSRRNRSSSQAGRREEEDDTDVKRRLDELQIELKRLTEEIKKKDANISAWEQLSLRKDKVVQQVIEKAQSGTKTVPPEEPNEDTRRKEELIKKLQVELDTAEYLLRRKKDDETKQQTRDRRSDSMLDTLCAHVDEFMRSMQRLQRGVARQDTAAIARLKDEYEVRKRELTETLEAARAAASTPTHSKTAGKIVAVSGKVKIALDSLSAASPNPLFQAESPAEERLNRSYTKYRSQEKQMTPSAGGLEQKIYTMEREKAKTDIELSETRQKLNDLTELIKDQGGNLSELRTHNAGLTTECKKLSEENSRLAQENDRLTQEFKKLMQDNKELYGETRKLLSENERLVEEQKSGKMVLEQKQQELASLNEAFEKLGEECVSKDQQLLLTHEPASQIQNPSADPKSLFSEAMAHVVVMTEEYNSRTEHMIREKDSRLSSLQTTISTLRQVLHQTKTRMRERLETIERKYKAALSKAQSDRATMAKQLTEKASGNAKLGRDIEAIKARLQQKCEEIEVTMQTALRFQTELEQVRDYLSSRESEYAEQCVTFRNIASMAGKPPPRKELKSELDDARSTIAEREAEIDRLKSEAEARQQEVIRISAAVKDAERGAAGKLKRTLKEALTGKISRFMETATSQILSRVDSLSQRTDSVLVSLMFLSDSTRQRIGELTRDVLESQTKNAVLSQRLQRKSRMIARVAQQFRTVKSEMSELFHGVMTMLTTFSRATIADRDRAVETVKRISLTRGRELEKPEMEVCCRDLQEQCTRQRQMLDQNAAEKETKLRHQKLQQQRVHAAMLGFSSIVQKSVDKLIRKEGECDECIRRLDTISAITVASCSDMRNTYENKISELQLQVSAVRQSSKTAVEILAGGSPTKTNKATDIVSAAKMAVERIRSGERKSSLGITNIKSMLIRGYTISPSAMEHAVTSISERIARVQTQLAKLRSSVAKLKSRNLSMSHSASASASETAKKAQRLEEERDRLRGEVENAMRALSTICGADAVSLKEMCEKIKAHCSSLREKASADHRASIVKTKSLLASLAGKVAEMCTNRIRVIAEEQGRILGMRARKLAAGMEAARKAVRIRGQQLRQAMQEKELAVAKSKGGYEEIINQMKADSAANSKALEEEYGAKFSRLEAERTASEKQLQSELESRAHRISSLESEMKTIHDRLKGLTNSDGPTDELLRGVGLMLAEQRKTVQSENGELLELRERLMDARAAMVGKEAENAGIRKRVEVLESDELALREETGKLVQEKGELEEKAKGVEQALSESKAQYEDAQQKLEQRTAECENQKAENELLRQESKRHAEQISGYEDDIRGLQERLASTSESQHQIEGKLRAQLAEAESLAAKLKNENTELAEKLERADEEIKTRQSENAESEQLKDELKTKTEILTREKDTEITRLTELQKAAEIHAKQQNEENGRIKLEAEGLRQRISEFLNASKTESAAMEASLRKELEAAHRENAEVRAEAEKHVNELSQAKKTLAENGVGGGEASDVPSGVDTLIALYEGANKGLQQAQKELKDLEDTRKEIAAKWEHANGRLEESEAELARIRKENEEVHKSLEEAKSEAVKRATELGQVKSALEQAQTSAKRWEDELSQAKSESGNIGEVLAQARAEARKLQEELSLAVKEREEIGRNMEQALAEQKRCKEELELAGKGTEQARAETEKYRDEVGLAKKENREAMTLLTQKGVGEVPDIVAGINRLIEHYESEYKELEEDEEEQRTNCEKMESGARVALLKALQKEADPDAGEEDLSALWSELEARLSSLVSAEKEKIELRTRLTALTAKLEESEERCKTITKEEQRKQAIQLEEMERASNKKDLLIQQAGQKLLGLEAAIRHVSTIFGLGETSPAKGKDLTQEMLQRFVEHMGTLKTRADSDLDVAAQKFRKQLDTKDEEIAKLTRQVQRSVCVTSR